MVNEADCGCDKSLEEQVSHLHEELHHMKTMLEELKDHHCCDHGDDFEYMQDHLQRRAKHFYANAKESGAEAMDAMKDRFYSAEHQICDYVREKPCASLAIAAGVGFFTALLTRR